MFSWATAQRPIIALSPMADMSDLPFCLIAKECGAEIMFREMVASEAIVRGNERTFDMVRCDERERPIIQQVFGSEPGTMARAAEMIEERFHPDGIDINMGCPVYKIVSNFNGASLMRDKECAMAIVRAIKSVITVPLSVKIRLGWSDKTEAIQFAKYLEEAGADLITVHGRTKMQGYAGESDWEMIARVCEAVSIPVLANGDVNTPEKVPEALCLTGCAGVLVARGCLGAPWFFRQARELVNYGAVQSSYGLLRRVEVCLSHARLHVSHYGPQGIVTFRKHLSWYLKRIDGVKPIREKALRVESLEELEGVLTPLLIHP